MKRRTKILDLVVSILVLNFGFYAHAIDNQLPGILYKTSIQISKKELQKNLKELNQMDSKVVNSVLDSARKPFQRNARVAGLLFCKKKGFESVASVFWRADILIGAHCLPKASDRSGYLKQSYAVGCQKLKITSKGCLRSIQRYRGYKLDFVDTTVEAETVQPSITTPSISKTLR